MKDSDDLTYCHSSIICLDIMPKLSFTSPEANTFFHIIAIVLSLSIAMDNGLIAPWRCQKYNKFKVVFVLNSEKLTNRHDSMPFIVASWQLLRIHDVDGSYQSRKRGPATAKYVTHTINGHCAIDRVLSPPHFEPTDLPPQENHPGLQSQRRGSQNPTQV